ncbi:G5 domain-containing protein [Lysinibacillus sp. NPDC097231]|uniref:G5 domain-containing protein n=1 Tax=Lysinibacillus sp. NPDC097231 TaxID=3364142 RepID=UPI00382CE764
MKTYIKVIGLLVVIVLIVGVYIPLLVLNGTVYAEESPGGSTIGGVSIEGLEREEAIQVIRDSVEKWQETPLVIGGGGIEQEIDTHDLQFDIEQVVAQYEKLTKKPWYAFWQKEKTVHMPIPLTVNKSIVQQMEKMGVWDIEKNLQKIIIQASYLKNHEVQAVTNPEFMRTDERIAFQIADFPADGEGVSKIIPLLNDVMLVPNQTISLLSLFGEQVGAVNDADLDFVASILYSVILQTDYEILERYSQQANPAYIQQGIEADVNATLAKDLQFINRSHQLGKLKATIEGNQLKIEIFATGRDKDITVRVSKDTIVKPRIIYRYSDDLKIGQERVEQEGKEGARVEVYRSIVEDGATEEQLISRDYYAPQNRIVTRSSKEPVTVTTPTQNAGANTTDPDLEVDLDGNGLPDIKPSTPEESKQEDGPEIVYGYYDKGGNFVQTSP